MHFITALVGLLTLSQAVSTKPAPQLGAPADLTFKSALDGRDQKYMQRLPADFNATQVHDVMIGLHGHGSLRDQFAKGDRPECKGVRDVAAKHNMIFMSPDYRGNSWMGPAAEADLVQFIGELKQKHKVGKVYLVGASMGGTSVLIFTALHPDLVDGVSSQNGIASLMEYDQRAAGIDEAIKTSYGGNADEKLQQFRERKPDEFKKRSPLLAPEKFTMPVAITVGEKDVTVPPKTTIELAKAIEKTNPDVLLISRKAGGHNTSYDDTVAAIEFVIERAAKKK